MRRSSRTLLSAGSAAAMVAATIVAAPSGNAAPSSSQCGFRAPNNGYVVADPATNTKCVTNSNGTYLFVQGARRDRCQTGTFVASFRVIPRAAVRPVVIFKFTRGNLVVTKRVALGSGQKASTAFQFKRTGRWSVVAIYLGKRVTSTVNVGPGGRCTPAY